MKLLLVEGVVERATSTAPLCFGQVAPPRFFLQSGSLNFIVICKLLKVFQMEKVEKFVSFNLWVCSRFAEESSSVIVAPVVGDGSGPNGYDSFFFGLGVAVFT